jgi:hypothetical protein
MHTQDKSRVEKVKTASKALEVSTGTTTSTLSAFDGVLTFFELNSKHGVGLGIPNSDDAGSNMAAELESANGGARSMGCNGAGKNPVAPK